MFDIPCVILAGGKSSRMGSDKALLDFGGCKSLCEYQYKRLKEQFSSVYVSTKEDKFDFGPQIIKDKNELYSPMVALDAILSYFDDGYVFIMSVDMPFVQKKQTQKMYKYLNEYDIIIPETKLLKHYLCGFYHTKIKRKIKKFIQQDNHKVGSLVKSSNTKFVNFDDEKTFANLNYIDEYNKAKI